jgi:nucleoid DNA-binding protein
MYEKPISMSMKDFIIRQMAVKLMVSESTIESVLNHQFQEASKALQKNYSVELSGFGKMYFNVKRARKRVEKDISKIAYFHSLAIDEGLSEAKRISSLNKLNNTVNDLRILKPRIDELFPDLRGVAEQLISRFQPEGADRINESGASFDMLQMHLPVGSEEKEAQL